jgi:hypothetical protein
MSDPTRINPAITSCGIQAARPETTPAQGISGATEAAPGRENIRGKRTKESVTSFTSVKVNKEEIVKNLNANSVQTLEEWFAKNENQLSEAICVELQFLTGKSSPAVHEQHIERLGAAVESAKPEEVQKAMELFAQTLSDEPVSIPQDGKKFQNKLLETLNASDAHSALKNLRDFKQDLNKILIPETNYEGIAELFSGALSTVNSNKEASKIETKIYSGIKEATFFKKILYLLAEILDDMGLMSVSKDLRTFREELAKEPSFLLSHVSKRPNTIAHSLLTKMCRLQQAEPEKFDQIKETWVNAIVDSIKKTNDHESLEKITVDFKRPTDVNTDLTNPLLQEILKEVNNRLHGK